MTDQTAMAPVAGIDPAAPVYNARLVRREDATESLASFWVRFDGDPTPFEPGQYMTIGVMVDGKLVQRPYSVAWAPPQGRGRG
jgi:ferredoxin-NADP reductase